MDYLQEGIHLRAYGQKDPLVEWQREGFEMFGMMMESIKQDFVKYVMHAQIQTMEQPAAQESEIRNVQYSAPADPSEAGSNLAAAAAAVAAEQGSDGGGQAQASAAPAEAVEENKPVIKSDWDKTPRNAPCPCGSGKKFKFCHGAT
jgi:preprotein translocase subunit SecA